ncbi:MAG: RsmB/NOP family class I SAM-dependent RNA methyltransferase [Flavobacteriales bacterium]|nr:RsmB/NOP family class I SAM-dependent RNA methyltransferase [Flavobacteriales bacterium]
MNLPDSFLELIKSQGIPDPEGFEQAHHVPPRSAFRRNPAKWNPAWDPFFGGTVLPWCPWGSVTSNKTFAHHPAFHTGALYVQEASSQFLWFVLESLFPSDKPRPPLLIVDLCAAPGGKSTLAASWKQNDDLLIALENQSTRLPALEENILKWGRSGVLVAGGPTYRWELMPGQADVVIADVPCSGEGLFRKDSAYVKNWRTALRKSCPAVQKKILQDATTALKPGGFLIYSTCTYNPEENILQMARLTRQGWLCVTPGTPSAWNLELQEQDGARGWQFYPHRQPGEGFFISVLQKPGEPKTSEQDNSPKSKKKHATPHGRREKKMPKSLNLPDYLEPYEYQGHYYAVPKMWLPLIDSLTEVFKILLPGVPLGTWRREKWEWHTAVGHCPELALDIPFMEVDYSQAVRYLACQTLDLRLEGPTLLRWEGVNLGLAKSVPGRPFVSLYPASWRLRRLPPGIQT